VSLVNALSMSAASTSTPAEIIANPLFKKGYEHFWSGEEPLFDRGWMPHEQDSYERGRKFAGFVAAQGEGKIALVRGFLPHPRAEALLLRALYAGEVV
jgi:hypothetical protein